MTTTKKIYRIAPDGGYPPTGGISNPTIETLQKISKALEVQVDDLLK